MVNIQPYFLRKGSEMSKYNIFANYSYTRFIGTVEAETEEEAIEKAEYAVESDHVLCHQCMDEMCDYPTLVDDEIIAELVEE